MTGTAKLQFIIDLNDKITGAIGKIQSKIERATANIDGKFRNMSANAIKALQKIGVAMNKLGTGMSNAFKKIGSVAKGAFSNFMNIYFMARASLDTIKSFQDAANESAIAESKLGQMMSHRMGDDGSGRQRVVEFAQKQQSIGVIDDDTQIAGAAQLAGFVKSDESIMKLMPAMNDYLAKQYDINATQEHAVGIAQLFGKALDGQTTALERQGYAFSESEKKIMEYGTEAQKIATLTDVIERKVGGMNEALANTPEGKIKQLQNTMGDLKEDIGKTFNNLEQMFLPIAGKFLEGFGKILEFLQPYIEQISTTFLDFFTRIGDLFSDNSDTGKTFFSTLFESAKPVFETILNIIVKLIETVFKIMPAISRAFKFIEELHKVLSPIIENVIDFILDIITPILSDVIDFITEISRLVMSLLSPVLDMLADKGSLLWKIINLIGRFIQFTVSFSVKLITSIVKFIGLIVEKIKEFICWVGGWLKTFFEHIGILDFLKDVYNFLHGVLSAAGTVFTELGDLAKDVFSGIGDMIKMIFDPSNWGNMDFTPAFNKIKKAADIFKNKVAESYKGIVSKIDVNTKATELGGDTNNTTNNNNTDSPVVNNNDTSTISKNAEVKNITFNFKNVVEHIGLNGQEFKDMSPQQMERKIIEIIQRMIHSAELAI